VVLGSTEPEYDSLEALIRLRDFVATSRDDLANPTLEFAGVIVSAHDQRVGAHVGQLTNVRSLFGDQVWGVVPQRAVLTNADEAAQPLSRVADSAEVRAVYELLAERLVKEVPTQ
jgi:chromosome partitioning protein